MTTSYPTGLDAFNNPTSGDNLDTVGVVHADQHANANDAIEAIEAELGTNPSGAAATVVARLDAVDTTVAGKAALADANVFTNVQQISTPTAATKGLIVKASASQSANLLEVQDSAAALMCRISQNGNFYFGTSGSYLSASSSRLLCIAASASTVPITAQAAASQTANLLELQNSAGTVVAKVDASGAGHFLSAINTRTASYTLALTDGDKIVEMNVASANNLTVPLNSSVAFPIGTRIDVTQLGAGQTTIVAAGGVTIRSSGAKLKLTGQYSGAALYKRGTDEWLLVGDIAA